MKFVCPKCERLVELKDFKLDGATLVVTCPACQAANRISGPSTPAGARVPLSPVVSTTGERPALQLTSAQGISNVVALRTPGADAVQAAAAAARTAPFALSDDRCPKCISPKSPGATSCAACGLTYSQFNPAVVEPPEWMKTEWVSVLSRWDDEEDHVALRQRALREQELAALGRLYRLRLAASAEDPIAQRGRDEVLQLALIRNPPASRAKPRVVSPAVKVVLVAVVLIACLVFLVLMARGMLTEPPG